MKTLLIPLLLVWCCPSGSQAQELVGPERQRVLETARSHYYSLTGLGVRSFTCGVNFDLGTISQGMLPETDAADRALLQSAEFVLKVTPGGATVRYQFPEGAVSQSQEVVAGVTLWITEIVQGFFQAWPAKGFRGPIPRDKDVQSVLREGEGFRLTVKGSGGMTTELRLDKDSTVREITSRGRQGEIDERPAFAATGDGLMFSGNETVDKEPAGVTQVKYAIDPGVMGGFRLPRAVHLVVGEHVDVRFGLTGCTVAMGKR